MFIFVTRCNFVERTCENALYFSVIYGNVYANFKQKNVIINLFL